MKSRAWAHPVRRIFRVSGLPLDREDVNKQARPRGPFRDPLSTSFRRYPFTRSSQRPPFHRKQSNLDINMSCIVPECTAAESSRLEKVSGHDYDPIVQELDEYELCNEHRCAFSTKRNNRCTDIVAQGPVELHARARKNRPTTTTYCKTHFGMGEQKRKGESETRPSRAVKKVIVQEDAPRYLYLRGQTPPAKPTIEGMQYSLETVRSPPPLPTFALGFKFLLHRS
jgi:hypothetical protein